MKIMIIVVLSLGLLYALVYIFRLKKDIARLGKSLQTIKNTNTNMRLTTTTFDKDVCDLCLLMNEVLDEQQKLVRESERTTREFRQGITNISHDLRTPLTSAVGYVQMIKSNSVAEAKKEEYLEIIENRLKSLISLMKELFDYTQIIEGKVGLNIEEVNICNVLRDQVATFYEDFMQKDFDVQIKIPDTPVHTLCDVQLFRRVTQNLIQNAIIHGVEYFQLSVEESEKMITFRNKVANMNEVDPSRIFERFYTVDASRTSKRTGLGLAITKELILRMNGKIDAYVEGDMLSICISLA